MDIKNIPQEVLKDIACALECPLVRAEINGNFESYIKVTSHLKLVRKRMEELGLLNENQKPEPAKNKENVPDCGTHET